MKNFTLLIAVLVVGACATTTEESKGIGGTLMKIEKSIVKAMEGRGL